MKKLVALLVVAAFFTAGCTGSFVLTKKVYNFHRDQEGKWMDELVFLGAVILPVYGLATLGDAIVFNLIEFWTEENPLQANTGDTKTISQADMQVIMTQLDECNGVKIQSQSADLIIERTPAGMIARDAQGNVLYISQMDKEGGVSIYNADNKLIKRYSARNVEIARTRLAQ